MLVLLFSKNYSGFISEIEIFNSQISYIQFQPLLNNNIFFQMFLDSRRQLLPQRQSSRQLESHPLRLQQPGKFLSQIKVEIKLYFLEMLTEGGTNVLRSLI
jgi:hypothetical protein